jgi:DNA replication and repair protein RecF
MELERLRVSNYKNIRQIEAEFSEGINLFTGLNGMGKTNLLDAIYYLSFCKSHTHTPDGYAVRQGEKQFFMEGQYRGEVGEEEIQCGYGVGVGKVFRRNKKEYGRLSDHIGLVPLVLISPQDGELVGGGGEARRRFMDMVISQYDRVYMHGLMQYNRALRQRNSMLRSGEEDGRMYEAIEAMLGKESVPIYEARRVFVEQLVPVFNGYYSQISRSQEAVGVEYVCGVEGVKVEEQLRADRVVDKRLGYTSRGVHRDDVVLRLRDQPLNYTGSQGQQKTALLSLKLAQYKLLGSHTRTQPILLLDDIFDKLDGGRVGQIMELVGGSGFGQIFITDTSRSRVEGLVGKGGSVFELHEGEVVKG